MNMYEFYMNMKKWWKDEDEERKKDLVKVILDFFSRSWCLLCFRPWMCGKILSVGPTSKLSFLIFFMCCQRVERHCIHSLSFPNLSFFNLSKDPNRPLGNDKNMWKHHFWMD